MIQERALNEKLVKDKKKENFGWKIRHQSKVLTLSVKNGSDYYKDHPIVYT